MKQDILKIKIGNFWIESNHNKIPFEIEKLIEGIKERLVKNTSIKNVDNYILRPDVTKISGNYYLVGDIDFSKWQLDNRGSGEGLFYYSHLNEENFQALGVSIEVTSTDNIPHFIGENERFKLGYVDLGVQDKSEYKVALSIGSYESKELLTPEEVEMIVFLSL